MCPQTNLITLQFLSSLIRGVILGGLEKVFQKSVVQFDDVTVVGHGVDHGHGAARVADGLLHVVHVLRNLKLKQVRSWSECTLK